MSFTTDTSNHRSYLKYLGISAIKNTKKIGIPKIDLIVVNGTVWFNCARLLDKREYLVIILTRYFLLILHKTYVVIPLLNRLGMMIQMRGTTYGFNEK